MSTCTDLINAINAVVEPPNFNDIAPNCASLSLAHSTPSTNQFVVQLSGGGNAILSPSVDPDGRMLRVKVAGNAASATVTSGAAFTIGLYYATTFSILSPPPQVAGITLSPTNSPSTTNVLNFYMVFEGTWSSVSQLLVGTYDSVGSETSSGGNTAARSETNGNTPFVGSASAYTGLQFLLAAYYNGVSGTPALNITQFSIESD